MKEKLLAFRDQFANKKQVSSMLYNTLKEAIATGTMPPGYRLKEEELAEWFEVSRTPCREAIKRLEYEGFVTSDHLHGSVVHQFELDECLDTLEVLEWMRNIALDLLNGRLPKSIMMQIEMNLRKGETLTDPVQRFDNNTEFHALLIRATANSELIRITRRLEYRERTICNTIQMYEFEDNYVQNHRALYNAVLDNNREYIENYKQKNREHVNKYMNLLIGKFIQE